MTAYWGRFLRRKVYLQVDDGVLWQVLEEEGRGDHLRAGGQVARDHLAVRNLHLLERAHLLIGSPELDLHTEDTVTTHHITSIIYATKLTENYKQHCYSDLLMIISSKVSYS